MKRLLCLAILGLSLLAPVTSRAGVVTFADDRLLVDGQPQPQLFGAELQYFRLRGGYERNVPRQKVIELWNRALDRMVEAKMNVISFYIPWDFHEYAEGKFDFSGTVDEDGDGRPDYPSRDLETFFSLIEQHGIRHVMVRPGPYINAEWGFLGFGAVPKWFHQKYPRSHMQAPDGSFTKLYDYHDPDFLRYSRNWIREVHERVLKTRMGPGKPIAFVQIDNETNFQWQSIYSSDYGSDAVDRYREFLKSNYATLADLNRAHARQWTDWTRVQPTSTPGKNLAEDRDWYRFQDHSIHTYLVKVREMWTSIGVNEPTVLFTLAESYNAAPNGLLPNYRLRNDPGRTGLMTVNLYPKTYELPSKPLLNLPFKADHDVKAADAANDAYLGSRQEWVMGPEIQGGWWRGIDISPAARRQTYLTTLGHGMKALFVYYFNEGQNWQIEGSVPHQERELFFDAPLDGNANPRHHFYGIKEIGEKLVAPYGDALARAKEMNDPVCFLREDEQHAPTFTGVDPLAMNGEWAGGLLGLLLQSGANPRFVHWGVNSESDLADCRLIVRQDDGVANPLRTAALQRRLATGAVVVNLIDHTLALELGLPVKQSPAPAIGSATVTVDGGASMSARAAPLFRYDLGPASSCTAAMKFGAQTVGYRCAVGTGTFIQIGAVIHDRFNSDTYSSIADVKSRRLLVEGWLTEAGIEPQVSLVEGGDRTVAFGRTDGTTTFVTMKTGQNAKVHADVRVRGLVPTRPYEVRDLFGGTRQSLTGDQLATRGFAADLGANGSTTFVIE